MKFYLKIWFLVFLLITSTVLFFTLIYLSDEASRLTAFRSRREKGEASQGTLRNEELSLSFFSKDGPTRGNPEAPLKVVEFSDFECPFCKEASQVLARVFKEHGDKVYFQYRHFPIENLHPHALKAAEASMCAGEQGKFWEYHDLLFENQSNLRVESLETHALSLLLDMEKFRSCLMEGTYASHVLLDFEEGIAFNVEATPTFFINGYKISGVLPFEVFERLIRAKTQRD